MDERTDGRATDGWIVCMSVSLSDRQIEDRMEGQTGKLLYLRSQTRTYTHAKIKHSRMHTKGWTDERTDPHTSI